MSSRLFQFCVTMTAFTSILALVCLADANPRQRILTPSCQQRVAVHKVVVQQQVYQAPYVATQVIPVAVAPDYYYSVTSYSRDRLLVDALAGRLLDLHRQGLFVAPNQPLTDPLPPKQFNPGPKPQKQLMPPAEAGIVEEGHPVAVDPKLGAVVAKSCLKCHQGEKPGGGLDLSNLGVLTRAQWLDCHWHVNRGSMPKGGQPIADADVLLFDDHVVSVSKK